MPFRRLAEMAMADPNVAIDVKVVMAMAMQRLPEDDLLDLRDRLVAEAAAGRLDIRPSRIDADGLLGTALFPHVNLNAYLTLAPHDIRVENLLKAAAAVPSLALAIAKARKGDAARQLFDGLGGAEPIVRLDYIRHGHDARLPGVRLR